jgi:hypothetical protein
MVHQEESAKLSTGRYSKSKSCESRKVRASNVFRLRYKTSCSSGFVVEWPKRVSLVIIESSPTS